MLLLKGKKTKDKILLSLHSIRMTKTRFFVTHFFHSSRMTGKKSKERFRDKNGMTKKRAQRRPFFVTARNVAKWSDAAVP